MALFSIINTPAEFLNTTSWFKSRFFVNFGCIEDGPGDDFPYSSSSMVTVPMSENPSLKKYFKSVSDQYSIGSCVANATADAFEAQLARRRGLSPSQVEDLSRLFIYWNARNLETPPTCNVDKGSRIRFAFDSMARYGVPSETIYPYDISKVNQEPTMLAYRHAIKNRISKFYRITATGQTRVGQIKQALCAGNPVVFGVKIAESFKAVNSEAIVYNPGGWYIGRHAMVVVGFSEEKQAFEIRNSWGESWGVKGYCWMDKNYLAGDIVSDVWVPTI